MTPTQVSSVVRDKVQKAAEYWHKRFGDRILLVTIPDYVNEIMEKELVKMNDKEIKKTLNDYAYAVKDWADEVEMRMI